MNAKQAEQEMRESKALVCSIPIKPSRTVSMTEYQQCIVAAKNKGQMLRCTFRVLSSMGYNGNVTDERFWLKIKEYIEDFKD